MSAVILTTGEASRRTDLSGVYLRKFAKSGKIASLRTERGQFLFEASEIDRFIREREQQGQKKKSTKLVK